MSQPQLVAPLRLPRWSLSVVLALVLASCAKNEQPPRFAPAAQERLEAREGGDDAYSTDDVDSGAAADVPDNDIDNDDAPEPTSETEPDTATAIDAELCRSACENALTVTLAELPASAAPSMREELMRALRDDCPTRCLQKASLESARCIASAKTALALASCP